MVRASLVPPHKKIDSELDVQNQQANAEAVHIAEALHCTILSIRADNTQKRSEQLQMHSEVCEFREPDEPTNKTTTEHVQVSRQTRSHNSPQELQH